MASHADPSTPTENIQRFAIQENKNTACLSHRHLKKTISLTRPAGKYVHVSLPPAVEDGAIPAPSSFRLKASSNAAVFLFQSTVRSAPPSVRNPNCRGSRCFPSTGVRTKKKWAWSQGASPLRTSTFLNPIRNSTPSNAECHCREHEDSSRPHILNTGDELTGTADHTSLLTKRDRSLYNTLGKQNKPWKSVAEPRNTRDIPSRKTPVTQENQFRVVPSNTPSSHRSLACPRIGPPLKPFAHETLALFRKKPDMLALQIGTIDIL